ncbi:B3 domain-containing protein At2g31720-like [Spinacia oleracea]|uniref:B3 domain-containing protein At2g31720-like n=1 Tax=Spinacia oleracea TaxID=3562 RepID=A0ABM3QTI0_SPIOL|nr:B3 domain-containing protein At2g31720-like [Spinacia oleracea]
MSKPKKRCPKGGESVGLLALLCHQIESNNMVFKDVSQARILLEKKLTESDMNDGQARLTLQSLAPFLTRDEYHFLKKEVSPNKMNKMGVKVIMRSSEYRMHLSLWNDNENNNSGCKFVLENEWNKLKTDNKLQKGDFIQILSFRSKKCLNFAFLGPKRSFKLLGTTIESYPW